MRMQIRLKLIVLVGFTLVLALSLMTYYSAQMARVQFDRMEEVEVVGAPPVPNQAVVDDAVARRGETSPEAWVQQLANQLGASWQVYLFDSAGALLAMHPARNLAQDVVLNADGMLRMVAQQNDVAQQIELKVPIMTLEYGDDRPGELLVLFQPPDPDQATIVRADRFASGLDRRLLLGLLVVIVAALLLVWMIASRILAPVSHLKQASSRLAAGHLEQRVVPQSRDELGDLATAFNDMSAALRRAEASRKALMDNTAHELRTPLTNIRCQLEAVQDGLIKPDAQTINSLYHECMLLNQLVDDLRDYALATAGKLAINLTCIALAPQCQKAIDAIQRQHNGPGPEIQCHVDPQMRIKADPGRLQQILRNLLHNAVRFTAATGNVAVRAIEKNDLIEISVQDDGIGIPSSDMPLVFERFTQSHAPAHDHSGGLGLGLAIVKKLVTLQGGSIQVASTPGEGSVFTITLPACSAETCGEC